MSVSITTAPKRIHSAYNQINFIVESTRSTAISVTINSVANQAGLTRFTTAAPHSLEVGDTITLSGFATATTYNAVATITAIGSSTFDTAIAFDQTDTGAGVRLNDNLKMKCEVTVKGNVIGTTSVLLDTDNEFKFDISSYIKQHVTYDKIENPVATEIKNYAFRASNSVADWSAKFTEVFDDDDGIPQDFDEIDTASITNASFVSGNVAAGGNTSVAASKLIDSGATFLALAQANQLVTNETLNTYTNILTVDSDIQLTLDADIFTATPQVYRVKHWEGGASWIYNNSNDTIAHSAGSTDIIFVAIPGIQVGMPYTLAFQIINRTAGSVTVSVGGAVDPNYSVFSANGVFETHAVATDTNVIFTPTSDFDGEIKMSNIVLSTEFRAINMVLPENETVDEEDFLAISNTSRFLNNITDPTSGAIRQQWDSILQFDFYLPNNHIPVNFFWEGFNSSGGSVVSGSGASSLDDIRGAFNVRLSIIDPTKLASSFDFWLEDGSTNEITYKYKVELETYIAKDDYNAVLYWVNDVGGLSSYQFLADVGRVVKTSKRSYTRGDSIIKQAYSNNNVARRVTASRKEIAYQMETGTVRRDQAIHLEDVYAAPIAFYRESGYSTSETDYLPVIINDARGHASDFEGRPANFKILATTADKTKGHQI